MSTPTRQIRESPRDPHEGWESTSALADQIEREGKEFYSMVARILSENNELKAKLSRMEVGFKEFKRDVVEMNREMARRIFVEPSTSENARESDPRLRRSDYLISP